MLDFYYSTMRGGKSTALLQRRFSLMSIGKNVLVMTSGLDDRYGIGKITSRMGPQCDAMVFTCTTDFDNVALFEGIDELILDEAQFLTGSQVRQIHRMASKKRQRISCYGLRTDFQGNPFEGAAMLLALADNLHAISTLCQCGAVATMNRGLLVFSAISDGTKS